MPTSLARVLFMDIWLVVRIAQAFNKEWYKSPAISPPHSPCPLLAACDPPTFEQSKSPAIILTCCASGDVIKGHPILQNHPLSERAYNCDNCTTKWHSRGCHFDRAQLRCQKRAWFKHVQFYRAPNKGDMKD